MGEIESVKLGRVWRVIPDAVEEYDKRSPERKNRNFTRHFIYQGGGGLLFRSAPDHVPPDTPGKHSGLQRQRRPLVYQPERSQAILLKAHKPVIQPELFSA